MFFEEWDDVEGYFDEIIEKNKEMNSNLTFEMLKEELIGDFY
jgi:hypothetical protein